MHAKIAKIRAEHVQEMIGVRIDHPSARIADPERTADRVLTAEQWMVSAGFSNAEMFLENIQDQPNE
jgi:hypothetical protein